MYELEHGVIPRMFTIYLGLTQKEFAEKIQVHFRSVQKWENGETEISPKNETHILNVFSENKNTQNVLDSIINDSFSTAEAEPITEYIQKENNEIGVPYYENMEVAGGITTMYSDFKEVPTFYINYEHFNDCTAYLPVVGDSMYPQYCSGEIVAVKRINNYNALLWGEAYFVVTNENANDLKTIKLLFSHEDDSKLILRASNPNFKGDTIIDKCDIIHIYSVKGKIKRNQL